MSKIIDLRDDTRKILRCVDGQHYVVGQEEAPITIKRAYYTNTASLLSVIEPVLMSATITAEHALFSVIANPAPYNLILQCVIYARRHIKELTIMYLITSVVETSWGAPLFLDVARREISVIDESTKRMSILTKLPSL